MLEERNEAAATVPAVFAMVTRARHLVERSAQPTLVQLLLRLALSYPFLKSGLLKWNGFLRLNDTAIYLFLDEFRLHLPGGPYSFPAPDVFAFLSGCGEVLFPILLLLGLGTRFAAIGLVTMTAIIQLTVPDGWPVHLTWVAMALAIAAWGPGRLSIDYVLGDRSPRS